MCHTDCLEETSFRRSREKRNRVEGAEQYSWISLFWVDHKAYPFYIRLIQSCVQCGSSNFHWFIHCQQYVLISLSASVMVALNSTYSFSVIMWLTWSPKRALGCICVSLYVLYACVPACFISKAAACASDWHWEWCTTFAAEGFKNTVKQIHGNKSNFQTPLCLSCDRTQIQRTRTLIALCLCLYLFLSLANTNKCKCTRQQRYVQQK